MWILQAVFIVSLATWLSCSTPAFADDTEAVSNTNRVKKTEEVRQKYIEKLEARLEKQNDRLRLLEKKIDTLSSETCLTSQKKQLARADCKRTRQLGSDESGAPDTSHGFDKFADGSERAGNW